MKEKYLRFRLKHLEKKLVKDEIYLEKINFAIRIHNEDKDWKLVRYKISERIYELKEEIAKIKFILADFR